MVDVQIFAASIALCAMLAVWSLKQPSQIAYIYILYHIYIQDS